MEGKTSIAVVISLTILALIIGFFGIAVLIGVGEAANNYIVAFIAVSLPFALLAGFLSWIDPKAQWYIAIAISAPVAILAILGSWSGGYLMVGAILTVAISCLGAYIGGRLSLSKSSKKQNPPPESLDS